MTVTHLAADFRLRSRSATWGDQQGYGAAPHQAKQAESVCARRSALLATFLFSFLLRFSIFLKNTGLASRIGLTHLT